MRRGKLILINLGLSLAISCQTQTLGEEGTLAASTGGKQVLKIASGGNFVCAIRDNLVDRGNFICWGDTGNNKLTPDLDQDIKNEGLSLQSELVDEISLGVDHGCVRLAATDCDALKEEPRCWGIKTDGRTPVPANIKELDVKSIVAGPSGTCVITKTDNFMSCWGTGDQIQKVPKNTAADEIAVGQDHVCYTAPTSGTVACVGNDGGADVKRTTPPAGLAVPSSIIVPNMPLPAPKIVAGRFHTCAINKNDNNRVVCWGGADKTAADKIKAVPITLGPVTDIFAGEDYTCAISNGASCARNLGKYVCWGVDKGGVSNRLVVPARLKTAKIKAGAPGIDYNCVLLADTGKVDCWGDDPKVAGNAVPEALRSGLTQVCGLLDHKCIFVSSATNNGIFHEAGLPDGLLAADKKCKDLANKAGICGDKPCDFKAWMCGIDASNAKVGPATGNRMTHSDRQYQLVDGTKVADNWGNLLSGSLNSPIFKDEFGNTQNGSLDIWTGVSKNGQCRIEGPIDCSNWTSAVGQGTTGRSNEKVGNWTESNLWACGYYFPWYCVEQ